MASGSAMRSPADRSPVGPSRPSANSHLAGASRPGRRFLHGLGAGPVLNTLHALVALDKFDDGDGCRIAMAITSLEHARIAARAALITRSQSLEELLDHRLVAHASRGKQARVQIPALGKRDVLVHHALEILGLGQRCDDLLVADEGRRQVGEHGLAMTAVAAKPSPQLAVLHVANPSSFAARVCGLAVRSGSGWSDVSDRARVRQWAIAGAVALPTRQSSSLT